MPDMTSLQVSVPSTATIRHFLAEGMAGCGTTAVLGHFSLV
ncbi:hypothetical protein [Agrobacterium sp. SORGH_AS 787]|nr:hypothetical protein [Rhizobium sp. SORGH_AS_0787]